MCSPRSRAIHVTLRALAAFLAVALAWESVSAQLPSTSGSKQPPVTIERVVFGFDALIPSETWAPLTVWLKGGEKGFSGAIVIEYDQDATQAARIIVPASATPGVSVPVQAAVCIPQQLQDISITVIDQEGRPVAATKLASFAGPDRQQWDATILPGGRIVLQIGECSLERAIPRATDIVRTGVDVRSLGVGLPAEKLYLERLRLVKAVQTPPFQWSAYSGLALLAVRADEAEKLDPRVLEAVHRWVTAGGRLLIVASRPGASWRSWLPPGELGEVVELHDLQRVPSPPALRETIASTREFFAPRATSTQPELVGPERPYEPVAPAPDVLARPLLTTKRATNLGWRSRFCAESGDESTPSGPGLIAEGPVGFGWVTITGFEPDTATATYDKAASIALWDAICSNALATTASVITKEQREQNGPYFYYFGRGSSSAPTDDARAALGTTLDALCSVSPPRIAFFIVIGIFLLILGVLLGPVDRAILRRAGLPHWSWATALFWITLASIAAVIAPSLVRSDGTRLTRARVVDSLPVVGAADDSRTLAWRTGVTTIFTDGTGPYHLENTDAASWWRGVGASSWYGHERMRGFSPVVCAQSLPVVGAPPPGCIPGPLSQGQWTLRCLQDDGPEPRVVRAAFSQDRDGAALRVDGIPVGSRLVLAAVQFKSGGVPLNSVGEALGANWMLRPVAGFAKPNSTSHVWKTLPIEEAYLPSRRTQAIEAMIDSGKWACLYMTLEEPASDVSLSTVATQSLTSTFRVLVPYTGELEDTTP